MPTINTITLLEILGSILTLWCIYLASKNKISSWPVSIIATVIYFGVYYHNHFYSDAYLQIAFIIFQIYGWWQWSKSKDNKPERPISKISHKIAILLLIISIFCQFIWYNIYIKINHDAKLPVIDTLTTILCLTASYMQAKRWIESWIIWIIADIIYVPMLIWGGQKITAILYLMLIFLAFYGWKEWKKIYKFQTA